MRLTHHARIGALLLFAAASLAACKTSGDKPSVAVEHTVVEVPRRQLVQVSTALTEPPVLAPAPSPAVPKGPKCDREGGCYSNRQLEGMLSLALSAYVQAVDNLVAIRRLMSEALQPKGKTHAESTAPVPGRDAGQQDP